MGKNDEKNFAFIDGANLYNGISCFGWKIDYLRFKTWLYEKYNVKTAYIFIGFIPKYEDLYNYLQKCGFDLIFKEVVFDKNGKAKGNCDAELVLQSVSDTYENNFDKAVIVSSDGDYTCLIKFLEERKKLKTILSPYDKNLCSILLKKTNIPICYLKDKKSILCKQK